MGTCLGGELDVGAVFAVFGADNDAIRLLVEQGFIAGKERAIELGSKFLTS